MTYDKFKTLRAVLVASTMLTTFAAPSAFAENVDGAEQFELQEIVVTANKREQNLRDVKSSLSVVTGSELENITATGFEDYLKFVSSVQFSDSGSAQTGNITIRGVTTSTSTAITQQTVGIYIDEIPFSDVFSFLSSPDLTPFDLERVEVLKGPQGALYGSGSMGGAIRYITAKPQFDDLEIKYNGALSSTKDGGVNTLNQAALNLPLGDKFAIRGVLSYKTDDGYVDNALTGEKDADDLKQFQARIMARLAPTEDLNILASYIYQDAQNGDQSTHQDITGELPVNTITPPFETDLEYHVANVTIDYDMAFADLMLSGSYAGKNRNAVGDSGPAATNATLAGFDFGLTGALGGIGAYTPGDLLMQGITSSILDSQPTSDAYFIEGRLTSKSDQRFRWMIGGLYTDIDNFNPIQQFIPGLNDALSAIVIPAPFDGLFGAPDAAALFGIPENDQLLDFFQASSAKEYAIYGEVQYDITDELEITAGGRYFDFEVSTQLGLAGAVLADIENEVSEFQPKVTLGYKPNDDVLGYFVFSRGYRVGGVNDTIALTLAPGQTIADSTAPLTYSTDNLYNYEIGVRTEWLEGALTFDVGVYYIDWSDIQLSSFFPAPLSPSGGVAAISNVGEASIYGFEVDLNWQITDNIRFASSLSYNDAQLDQDSPAVPNIETGLQVSAPEGTQLPGSRKWQTSTSLIVSFDITNRPATLALSHQYASSTLNDIVFLQRLDSYHLVDMNFDVDVTDNVRIGLFAKNLFDERTVVSLTPANPGFGTPRSFVFTNPRTIGISLSANF